MVVVLQALAVYQLEFRPHGPPSFRRGGAFVAAGAAGRPYPYTAAGVDLAGVQSTTTTVPASSSASTTTGVSDAGATVVPVSDADGTSTMTSSTNGLPAVATYTYAVAGSEGATAFGSRSYPSTMTFDVHTSPDLDADELVADLRFSEDHQEREILRRTADGLAFAFEGGSITFGPGTQTSEADYDPPMVQIPTTLRAGFTMSGTSAAKNSDGSTSRVEDWSINVIGQEVVDVGGTSIDTWVVDLSRTTRPGSSDQVNRTRRYWYDPVRSLWVRWHEVFHGERGFGAFTFTYDTDYTATLTALP